MTAAARRSARLGPAEQTTRDMVPWGLALALAALLYYVPGNTFGGTIYVGGGTVLMPLGLLALATLCYLRTELAVMLLPLAVPFVMLPRHIGTRYEFSLSETLVLLCTAAVLARLVVGNPPLPQDAGSRQNGLRALLPATPFEWPALLFLLAALAATAGAMFHSVALRELRVMIVEPMLYYVLVVVCLRTGAAVRGALYATVGAGLLVSVLGLGQALLRPASQAVAQYSDQALHMVSSVYSSENNLGLFLDRAVPMALAVALLCRLPRRRAAAGVAVAVMALVLVLTHSRGAWLATAIACAVVVGARYPRWRVALATGGALGVLLLVLIGLQATGPLARFVGQGHGRSTQARIYVWQSAVHMIRDHPILGVGPDNFLYHYSGYGFRALPQHPPLPAGWVLSTNPNNYNIPGHSYMVAGGKDEPFLSHPHNVVLDFWLSTGLLGLIAAAWLLAVFLRRAHILYYGAAEEECGGTRLTVLMAVAAQVGLLAHGLVDNSYFVVDLAMVFWLCLAAVAVEWRTRPGADLSFSRQAQP